ncbi:MAG: hypothetical protein M1838_004643 [Thelocarpon superellum]|nr:MAG: hypothetical protein M1838_004643 [Thelocarpon superellum]
MMMWKRLQGHHRPVIGHPVLIETTLDENALHGSSPPGVEGPYDHREILAKPEHDERALPPMPLYVSPNGLGHDSYEDVQLTYHDSIGSESPPMSYRLEGPSDWENIATAPTHQQHSPLASHPEQPSPPTTAPSSLTHSPPPSRQGHHPHTATTSTFPPAPSEISPPSSPGTSDGGRGASRVSPVEDRVTQSEAGAFQWGPPLTGPSYTAREPSRLPVAVAQAHDAAHVTTERGSVMTSWGDFATERQARPGNASFAERVLKARQTGLRPEGAKVHDVKRGVAVLQNTVDALAYRTPPARPPRTESMLGPFGDPSPASAVYSPGSASHAGAVKMARGEDGIRPTPPLKLGRHTPPQRISPPPRAKSPAQGTHQKAPSNDLGLSTINSIAGVSNTPVADGSKNTGVRNRDSASATAPRTPLSSTPMGTNATVNSGTRTPPYGVLDRPRPVPGPNSPERKSLARKAVPARTPTTSKATPRKVTPASPNKSLPQSPPEAESVDLITSLQAQLDSLHNRRRNLERIIKELTNLLPNTAGTPSAWELDRRADTCRSELAEVAVQEHDLGIKLHRAWRRRDAEENSGEPTGLWVRRVAG